MANQNKFYDEADKNYWKAIAELLPNEVPTIEKKKGQKDQEKKPSIVVIQGPNPGKPTDISRMRQVLLKLKHNAPNHLNPAPAAPAPTKDTKTSDVAASSQVAVDATAIEVVAAAWQFHGGLLRCHLEVERYIGVTLICWVYISKLATCAVCKFCNSIILSFYINKTRIIPILNLII